MNPARTCFLETGSFLRAKNLSRSFACLLIIVDRLSCHSKLFAYNLNMFYLFFYSFLFPKFGSTCKFLRADELERSSDSIGCFLKLVQAQMYFFAV